MRKRSRREDDAEVDQDAFLPMSNVDHPQSIWEVRPYHLNDNPASFAQDAPLIHNVNQQHPRRTLKNAAPPQSHITPTTPAALWPSTPPVDALNSLSTGAAQTAPTLSATPNHHLTPEQARFVLTLYNLNTPPTEVADLMNVMRVRREQLPDVEGRSGQAANGEPAGDSPGA
jgi:hypothetical protein